MRIGSITLSSLASGSTPLLEIAVGTPPIDGSKLMAAASATEISNGQGQDSKPSSGPALLPEVPTRWLQRGIERGFDPFADATSDSGKNPNGVATAGVNLSIYQPYLFLMLCCKLFQLEVRNHRLRRRMPWG